MRDLKNCSLIFLMWVLIQLTTSCSEDEYKTTFPPVVLLYATVQADMEGNIAFLTADDRTYRVLEDKTETQLKPEEKKRVVCYYELNDSQEAVILYSLLFPVASDPIPLSDLKEIKNDPINVQSSWWDDSYLNIIAQIQLNELSKHKLAFVEDRVSIVNGVKNVILSLYHDANGDLYSYTERIYLSIPLHKYQLKEGEEELRVVFYFMNYAGKKQMLSWSLGRDDKNHQ